MSNYSKFCAALEGAKNPETIFDELCYGLLKSPYDPDLYEYHIDGAILEAMSIKETE